MVRRPTNNRPENARATSRGDTDFHFQTGPGNVIYFFRKTSYRNYIRIGIVSFRN